MTAFVDSWRRTKSAAFDLEGNSTVRRTQRLRLWGRDVLLYANANFSIYSAQRCNAACRFCVEELRPASRGVELSSQKTIEEDDERYFARLQATLAALGGALPSISITGGEPSKDARLPRLLRMLDHHFKRTMTTNASGLFDLRERRPVIDWIVEAGIDHLNLSVAHPDPALNARLMRLPNALSIAQLRRAADIAIAGGVRPRLSCVLLRDGVRSFDDVLAYLRFAQSLGIDNVIFRQLMLTDPRSHRRNAVVRYSERQRGPPRAVARSDLRRAVVFVCSAGDGLLLLRRGLALATDGCGLRGGRPGAIGKREAAGAAHRSRTGVSSQRPSGQHLATVGRRARTARLAPRQFAKALDPETYNLYDMLHD